MDVAYAVLKNWQYDDVKYYENFIYAVLSQFNDLYQAYENKAMMDVADLYIEHGDYGLGDANYAYILRENQSKITSIIDMPRLMNTSIMKNPERLPMRPCSLSMIDIRIIQIYVNYWRTKFLQIFFLDFFGKKIGIIYEMLREV